MDPAHKTLTVPNGTLNRHHQQQQQAVYRECLKNHAASLGGHSLDGCGEFMASPSSDPTSLACAACGCHRNFHRRLPLPSPPKPLLHRHQQQQQEDHDNNNEDDEEDGSENDRREDADGKTGDNNNTINNHINNGSVPHMLMALSSAAATGTTEQEQRSRKRLRTRFSPEQKGRMQELSERVGWRMQKREEGLVEDRCREIGARKGVFKVWMHNNKHNFVHRSPSSLSLAIPTVSAMSTLRRGDSVLVNVRANGPVSGSTAS